MRRKRSAVFFLWIFLLGWVYLSGSVATAQNIYSGQDASTYGKEPKNPLEIPPSDFKPLQEQRPLEGPMQSLLKEDLPALGQPLEGPVDPLTYCLGPGDLIAVFVSAKIEQQLLARVTADGMLRIPTLGLFSVQNRLYGEVRDEILQVARSRYKAEGIAVSIIQVREFKASVGGMVWAPGTYKVTATDRVSALISRAGGFYKPLAPEESPSAQQLHGVTPNLPKIGKLSGLPGYSTRHAQLIHRDGSRENVDLLLFLRAGLPEGNPALRDGDFLLIPPLSEQSGVLGIFGQVQQQGVVEYVAGDNLGRALSLAGNVTGDALLDSIEITHFVGDGSSFRTVYVNLNEPGALETPLFPDDRIFVRPKPQYHRLCQVEVRGEVAKPGFYPVTESGIKLSELIKTIGGFTPRASLSEATLIRWNVAEQTDPEYERLLGSSRSELSRAESEYVKIKTRERSGRLAINLTNLVEGANTAQDVMVLSGDILEVPAISNTVTLTGQLKNPGLITFTPGSSYKDYINESGGFASNADKSHVMVIKARTGTWIKAKSATIEEGDTIFVPGRPDFSAWQFTKEVLLVITQFATIYLIIKTTKG
ncbi:MAG: SLBB domain-containing protein [bacterium]|nr:SLBB domain-containing protein [bacterium]